MSSHVLKRPARPVAAMLDNRRCMLALICGVLILSMSTWFSAAAILAQLQSAYALSDAATSWLTNAVQAGFVVGALASSLSGLPDRVAGRALIVAAALLAAAANIMLLAAPGTASLLAARFVTGAALAGIYPTSLKVIASWFAKGRGIAMGIAVGALTLGSASPYLLRAVGARLPWEAVVMASSACAVLAGLLALAVKEGPHGAPRRPFDRGEVVRVLRDGPLMLANLGYFGHMWELYGLWGWFLSYSTAAGESHPMPLSPALLTFDVVAVGAIGCLLGGIAGDRFGRTPTTAIAMAVSGSCALTIGVTFHGPAWLFILIAAIWGISVIADSAQFSAMVTELSDRRGVGTALTLQVGIGFALTVVAIRLVPMLAAAIGWRWVFVMLAPGPYIGAVAMLLLRAQPRAASIANGRR